MTKFKEFKKTVATILAAAMVFSPITSSIAFAADVTTAPANGSVSSSGGTEGYVDQEAFCVVLPTVTSNTLEFKLDPQGLLTVSGNDSKFANVSAGDIVFMNKISVNGSYGNFNESNVIYAINKSSYDVTFGVDVTMTNGTSTNQVTFVSSADLVTSGNDLNVYMAAVPETNAIAYDDVSGNGFAAVASTPSSVSFALNTAGAAKLAYKISGLSSNYTISKNGTSYNYVQKDDATGWQSVGFTLTGKCNPNANWKEFNDANAQLTLNLAWTLTKASGSEENYVSSNNPAGLIKNVAPTQAYAMDDGTAVYVALGAFSGTGADASSSNPGFEDAEASDVTNLTINGKSVSPVIQYDYLTISYDVFTDINETTPPYVINFTYNGTNYTVTLTE